MSGKSIWAVAAGVIFIVVVSTLADAVFHAVGVYPPWNQPIDDTLALLATSYRFAINVGGAWLTARLAPSKPMKHALTLGVIGTHHGNRRRHRHVEPGDRAGTRSCSPHRRFPNAGSAEDLRGHKG